MSDETTHDHGGQAFDDAIEHQHWRSRLPEPYCPPPMTTFQRRGMEMGTLQRDDVVLHFEATGSGASRLVEGAEVEATRRNLGQLLRARFTGLETGRTW
jgi:hypothetical protein